MDKDKLQEIKKKIERVKIIGYKEEEVIANSNFLSIVRGEYTLNNNNVIIRDKVVKNVGTGNAVCIFALTKENKLILVIQPRASIRTQDKVTIEFPAGYIEEKEDEIKAAKRELQEETGYVSSNIVLLDSYYPSQGASSEKISLVVALDCEKKKEQTLDKDEFVEFIELSLEEYEYLLNNNYIVDGTSRIAYYKAIEYIEKYLSTKLVNTLKNNKQTISTMESCTGGYLASTITNIEDSSKVLSYSAVTYSNEYKIKMGVNKDIIDNYSVYSIECAKEMSLSISKYTNSTYAIGITGTLKKYDENNKTKDNDLVYYSIYNKDTKEYYTNTIKVYSLDRVFNKKVVVINILNNLLEIIGK